MEIRIIEVLLYIMSIILEIAKCITTKIKSQKFLKRNLLILKMFWLYGIIVCLALEGILVSKILVNL